MSSSRSRAPARSTCPPSSAPPLRPAGRRPRAGGSAPPAAAARTARRTPSIIDEQNFQATIEASRTAPVLLAFYSRSRMPESGELADDLATLSGEFEGRFLAGLVDIDAVTADRPGDADPVDPAGGGGPRRAADAAAPGRRTRSTSCAPR